MLFWVSVLMYFRMRLAIESVKYSVSIMWVDRAPVKVLNERIKKKKKTGPHYLRKNSSTPVHSGFQCFTQQLTPGTGIQTSSWKTLPCSVPSDLNCNINSSSLFPYLHPGIPCYKLHIKVNSHICQIPMDPTHRWADGWIYKRINSWIKIRYIY